MSAALRAPSGVITLPRFVSGLNRRYITKTGDQFQPMDVALALALSVRLHGTVDAARSTARRLSQRVCMEHRPRLTALARRPTNIEQNRRNPREKLNGVMDDDVLWVAQRIIERVTDALGIASGVPVEMPPAVELVEPPRCHLAPMKLAGYHEHRHWRCQHCSHTKPLDWKKPWPCATKASAFACHRIASKPAGCTRPNCRLRTATGWM